MINPIELSEKTEGVVSRGLDRKYYRFRPAPYYTGISTGDCVGCNLRCIYCWSWNIVSNPQKAGRFYSAEEVSSKLTEIARRKGFKQIRISGNEPTLSREHLLRVLENIPKDLLFILETNGILLGHQKGYADELARFKNLHVRVSLKGTNPEEFSKITGAEPQAFEYQLKALENLEGAGVDYHPALAGADLIPSGNIEKLKDGLKEVNSGLPGRLEMEYLIKYPRIVARLRKAGLALPD